MPVRIAAPSSNVLALAPSRSLIFLSGISRRQQIFRLLASRGYTLADHREGWALLLASSGYDAVLALDPDGQVASAIAEIDRYDEPNFRIARAALQRRFGAQHDFVFANLEPARGAESLISVTTFLDRLDALEHGHGRDKADRKEDHAALALLASRGITAESRQHLRGLLSIACGNANTTEALTNHVIAPSEDDKLRALYAWYAEWSEVAHVVIKRRDHLISLGLATRRSRQSAPADEEPSESNESNEPNDSNDSSEQSKPSKPAEAKPSAPTTAKKDAAQPGSNGVHLVPEAGVNGVAETRQPSGE